MDILKFSGNATIDWLPEAEKVCNSLTGNAAKYCLIHTERACTTLIPNATTEGLLQAQFVCTSLVALDFAALAFPLKWFGEAIRFIINVLSLPADLVYDFIAKPIIIFSFYCISNSVKLLFNGLLWYCMIKIWYHRIWVNLRWDLVYYNTLIYLTLRGILDELFAKSPSATWFTFLRGLLLFHLSMMDSGFWQYLDHDEAMEELL